MKHLKTYENINKQVEVGDYVIANEKSVSIEKQNFFKNNIGKITNITSSSINKNELNYRVEYENNIPKYPDHIWIFSSYSKDDEFLYTSKNKEELIPYITTMKYNL